MLRLVTVVILGLFSTQALAQSEKPVGEAANAVVSGLIQKRMANAHVPGAQVAVVRHGRVAMLESYGLANIEHEAAVTDDSVFALKSITKVFSTVAVL